MRAGEGSSRGWDGWIASSTQGHEFEQTPGNSGGWRSLGSHRVIHDLATDQQQQEVHNFHDQPRCPVGMLPVSESVSIFINCT